MYKVKLIPQKDIDNDPAINLYLASFICGKDLGDILKSQTVPLLVRVKL